MSNFDIEIGEYEQSAEVMKNARDAILYLLYLILIVVLMKVVFWISKT